MMTKLKSRPWIFVFNATPSVLSAMHWTTYSSNFHVTGIGFHTIETAGEIAVQRSFREKRVLANGIATSGTGFGMLAIGPLIQLLLSYYGAQGTFLILSGVTLNGVVFGLLVPASLPHDEELTCNIMEQNLNNIQDNQVAAIDKEKTLKEPKKGVTVTARSTTSYVKAKEEKSGLKSDNSMTSTYSSINSKDEIVASRPEGNGYQRLFKNVSYILFSVGGILIFTVTKTVIGNNFIISCYVKLNGLYCENMSDC